VPDFLLSWAQHNLESKDFIKISECGYRIATNKSNFNKFTKTFINHDHAMHIDAHLAGQYFKKITLKNANASYIDSIVKHVNLNSENGFVKSVVLDDSRIIEGDFFIDCSGFNRVLMNELPNKWVSYQDNLPLNSAIPFLLVYDADELPVPYTTAWAQQSGWMWTVPLMDRKGNGYAFCDAFTTADKAQQEIETILGKKINPARVIKFDSGRQENAWVKNCVAIGLSSAFLEPLEATSIHSSIVQAQLIVFEYLKPTLEETLNTGARNIHNQRVRKMYDDVKDFLVMHYMGGRDDSEFWKYIKSGVVKTEFVSNLLEMAKTKVPSSNDFPSYPGSAGWPLYSFVMAGLNLIAPAVAKAELNFQLPIYGDVGPVTAQTYYDLQDSWRSEFSSCYTYTDFIKYIRDIRHKNGISNKQY
jgi:tryptophan halogenase